MVEGTGPLVACRVWAVTVPQTVSVQSRSAVRFMHRRKPQKCPAAKRVNETFKHLKSLWLHSRSLPGFMDTFEFLTTHLSTCLELDVHRLGFVYMIECSDIKAC